MNARRSQSAGIAGFAFLACIAMVGFVWLFSKLREFGPVIRELIHWLLAPQFVLGMLLMGALTCLCGLAIARSQP